MTAFATIERQEAPALVAQPGAWPTPMEGADVPKRTAPQWMLTPEQAELRTSLSSEAQAHPLTDRLLSKVIIEDDCWVWAGFKMSSGYGGFQQHGNGRYRAAHRVTYESWVGPIPDGLHLDHLCRVRPCVRPDHLDPVTIAENNRRMVRDVYLGATHCKRGHLWTENERRHPAGYRYCAACHRERESARRHSLPNVLRTHCPEGHAIAGDNLYVDAAGKRFCATCRLRAYAQRRKVNPWVHRRNS